jgi:hypothetical protein
VVAVRVADDDRGRVPFALVAVLLLLGSATYVASMHGKHPGGADPDTGAAIDRAESVTRTVLTQAVAKAARRAGQNPVLTPANTTYGTVIGNETPFRHYLRIRIYHAAQRSLDDVEQTVGDVSAGSSLPPVENASDLRRAKGSVSLARNGSSLEVTVRNVTVTARKEGTRLASERRNVSVAVDSPVLALHDRTQGFEARLNAEESDLRFSGLLYAIGWSRGYLQYGKVLPIENVIANRHVELVTNEVALSAQRAAFGRADREGTAALGRAFVQVGLRDVIASPASTKPGVNGLLGKRPAPTRTVSPVDVPELGGPDPSDTISVGINETADVALARLLRGSDRSSLESVVSRTYGARAELAVQLEPVFEGPPPQLIPPGPDWTLTNRNHTLSPTVEDAAFPSPRVPENWTGREPFSRKVTVHHTRNTTWTNERHERTKTTEWDRVYYLGFRIVVRHAPSEYAPHRPIAHLHERGGPLNGTNLAGGPAEAHRRLVTEQGGGDDMALAALRGELKGSIRIERDPPNGTTAWVYEDLRALRERVRNVSVEVPRGKLATSVNAPKRLVETIRTNYSSLLDAPDRYRSVADKARVAARGAYLSALERRAEKIEESREGLDDALSNHDSSLSEVQTDLRNRDASRVTTGGIRAGDDVIGVTVDGAPSYLPLASVTHERVAAVEPGTKYHALAARNLNVFTVPHGDAGEAVADAVTGGSGGEVSLRTAARTVDAAEGVLENSNDSDLGNRTTELKDDVTATVRDRGRWLGLWLGDETNLTNREGKRAVAEAWTTYDETATLAAAVANGSAAVPVAEAVDHRLDLDPMARDRIEMRIRLGLVRNLSKVRVDSGSISPVTNATRTAAKKLVKEGVANGVDNVTKKYKGKLQAKLDERYEKTLDGYDRKRNPAAVSAGLPLLPVPPTWYVTINVWVVDARGEYARFTVRADRGGPEGSVSYTRDGDPVAFDVDGDGEDERLGTATRISFGLNTAVVVAVPPGPNGVGDTDGNMVEESKGWCRPGPAEEKDGDC